MTIHPLATDGTEKSQSNDRFFFPQRDISLYSVFNVTS